MITQINSWVKKAQENRLNLAVWLVRLAAFIFNILWTIFVLKVDESHSLVAADWWPWGDKSAVEALYLAPHCCLAIGVNSVVFALIRQRTPLFVAGSFNLLISALGYPMVWAAIHL